jgi:hypothetical protein
METHYERRIAALEQELTALKQELSEAGATARGLTLALNEANRALEGLIDEATKPPARKVISRG